MYLLEKCLYFSTIKIFFSKTIELVVLNYPARENHVVLYVFFKLGKHINNRPHSSHRLLALNGKHIFSSCGYSSKIRRMILGQINRIRLSI